MTVKTSLGVPGALPTMLPLPATMFVKLGWEILQLRAVPPANFMDRGYHVMNCALTAWHLYDWIWALCPPPHRAKMCGILGCANDIRDFGGAIAKQSAAIEVCRQIATATKHVGVDGGTVTMQLKQGPNGEVLVTFEGATQSWVDHELFEQAAKDWEAIMNRLGVFQAAAEHLQDKQRAAGLPVPPRP